MLTYGGLNREKEREKDTHKKKRNALHILKNLLHICHVYRINVLGMWWWPIENWSFKVYLYALMCVYVLNSVRKKKKIKVNVKLLLDVRRFVHYGQILNHTCAMSSYQQLIQNSMCVRPNYQKKNSSSAYARSID